VHHCRKFNNGIGGIFIEGPLQKIIIIIIIISLPQVPYTSNRPYPYHPLIPSAPLHPHAARCVENDAARHTLLILPLLFSLLPGVRLFVASDMR